MSAVTSADTARGGPRLLLINPNTTASVTDQLRARAEAASPPGGLVHAATAAFGAAYIADEPGAAIAAHAGLAAYAAHVDAVGEPAAVLIGCFGDPGLEALRAVSGAPVHGLAEAAMAEAAQRGRFAIVTGGLGWPPMLRRLVGSLGLEASLAGIVAIERTGGELAANPAGAVQALREACEAAIERHRPDVLVLGGAALTGYAPALAATLPLPLLDSVETAVSAAWRSALRAGPAGPARPRVREASKPSGRPTPALPSWSGLSPALQSLLSLRSDAAPS